MKNLLKVKAVLRIAGIIALVAAIGFSMVSCGGGGGGGGKIPSSNTSGSVDNSVTYSGTASDNTKYTLTITKSTSNAKYVAKPGDGYVLAAGTKKSTGTVDKVSGSTITLAPKEGSGTIIVTTSGSKGISNISKDGDVKWDNGDTFTAPGTFTPPSSGSGLTELPGTNGSLTVTDFPSDYNGKWVMAIGGKGKENKKTGEYDLELALAAFDGADEAKEELILTKITGGKATLKVWELVQVSEDEAYAKAYSGSDTLDVLALYVINRGTLTIDEFLEYESMGEEQILEWVMALMMGDHDSGLYADFAMYGEDMDDPDGLAGPPVKFVGGKATIKFVSLIEGFDF